MTAPFRGRTEAEVVPAVLSARGLPQRALLRSLSLRAADGELRLVRGERVVERLSVGPHGDVSHARHLGGPVVDDVAPGFLGAVDLLSPDGAVHRRLLVRDWVPEADDLTRPAEALDRSGLVPLLNRVGLALRPVPPSELAAALDAAPRTWPGGARVPWSYTILRSVAVCLAFVTLILVATGSASTALGWIASGALMASTLCALALWLLAMARDRAPGTAVVELGPHPAAAVTRRFASRCRARVEADAVVVTDALGQERRLPLTGPLGVSKVAVVRSGTQTAQVEFRSQADIPRATLPWNHWFSGPDGAKALGSFCTAAGLPLELHASPAARPRAEEEAARAVYSPPPRRRVRQSTWPHGLPGQSAVWQSAAFAAFLVLAGPGAAHPIPRGAQLLAGAVVVLVLGCHLTRLLVRRWWLDVPVAPRG